MDAGPASSHECRARCLGSGASRVRGPVMGVGVAAGWPLLLVVMTAPAPEPSGHDGPGLRQTAAPTSRVRVDLEGDVAAHRAVSPRDEEATLVGVVESDQDVGEVGGEAGADRT